MLTKGDGMIAIVDMAISLVEFLVNLIMSLASGDFSALSDLPSKLTEKKDLNLF